MTNTNTNDRGTRGETTGRPKWTRKGQRMIDKKNRQQGENRRKKEGLVEVVNVAQK